MIECIRLNAQIIVTILFVLLVLKLIFLVKDKMISRGESLLNRLIQVITYRCF